jgi:hypothetical protein
MLNYSSCNQSGSGSGVILEGRGNLLLRLVVTSKTVDTRLDQDKTELGVLVFAVDLEVLAHGHRLFDEVPKVLWDGWCQSYPQTKGMYKNEMQQQNCTAIRWMAVQCMSVWRNDLRMKHAP